MKLFCHISIALSAVLFLFGICHAQSSAAGKAGGLVSGGAGTNALISAAGKTIDRSIFSRLSKAGTKNTAVTRNRKPASPKTAKSKLQGAIASNTTSVDILKFRPLGNSGADLELANLLTAEPDEKQALILIFGETKKAYDSEAARFGKKNDLALALTFFIQTGVMIHNDAPEPSDESVMKLYDALAESMLESKEIAQMSNSEKQHASDTLVFISGLIIAGYTVSVENQDQETLELYRRFAGDCIESLTGISAAKMEFDENGLKIRS